MSEIRTFNFTPINNERQQIHILLFITRGSSKHLIDFDVHDIKKGDFFIIRPGQVHAFFQAHDSDGTIIAFTEDFLLQRSKLGISTRSLQKITELHFGKTPKSIIQESVLLESKRIGSASKLFL